MNRLPNISTFLVVFALAISTLTANAQTVVLKDGQTLNAKSVSRSGDTIKVKIVAAQGSLEVSKPISQVDHIDFTKPPELAETKALIAKGQATKALIKIDPIVSFFAPFKDITGNWWSDAALLKITALIAADKEAQASALINEIATSSKNPEAVLEAKLRLAESIAHKGDQKKAEAAFQDIIQTSKSSSVLAEAWVDMGNSHFTGKEFKDALLAYLHVPVFYSQQKLSMPKALLGAARSLIKMQDKPRAKGYLEQIIQNFPSAPERTVAEKELKNLN